MEQYLHSIYNATDDLTTLDHPIPDMDLAAAILMSLPPSYDSLINSLDYTKGSKLDINYVIAYILKCDHQLKSKNGESVFYSKNRESAFYLKKGKGKYQTNEYTIGRNECRYCHRHGHYEKDCRKKKADEGKKDETRTQNSSNKVHAATEFAWVAQEFDQYQALVAAESRDHWIADLGATIHIAYDCTVFITYEPTPGHTIQGVGSMPVMGWGNIKILLSVNRKTSEMTLMDVIHTPQMEFNLLSIPHIANGLFDIHFRT